MSINALLRASLEEATAVAPADAVDNPAAVVANEFVATLTETESPIAIATEIQESENLVEAVTMIGDKAAEAETADTPEAAATALEAASFGWELLCQARGMNSNSISVESHSMESAVDRVMSAAVESIAGDAEKLAKRFDASQAAIANVAGIMNRTRREIRSSASLIDEAGFEMNLSGVYSFLSRNFQSVPNIREALEQEERNIDTMLGAVKDLEKEIISASKAINKLVPGKDDLTSVLRHIDDIGYDRVYSKLLNMDLLHSGVVEVESFDEYSVPLLSVNYHNIKDGSKVGARGWLRLGATAALTLLGTLVASRVNPLLGVTTGAVTGFFVGRKVGNTLKNLQGSNTFHQIDANEMEKILDSAGRILEKGRDYRRQMAEIKMAVNSMARVATTFANYAKDNDPSWQSVASTGLHLAASVALVAMGKDASTVGGHHSGEKVPPIVSETQSKIYWAGVSHEAMLDAIFIHIGVVGTGALGLCSRILHAVGSGKAN